MKWIALLCIVFAIRTSAQTSDQGGASTPIPTATSKPNPVAIDWHYDAEQQLLTLHLVNNSGKDITAYNISITRKYADGSADGSPTSESMEEMLGGAVNSQLTKDSIHQRDGNGTFAAGTSKYQHIPETKNVSEVKAVVDMVTYADATADVQNKRAFQRLMAMRKGQLMALERIDEVIKRELEGQNSSPISAALAELKPLLVDSLDGNSDGANQEEELRSAVNNLQGMQHVSNERESLTRYVEDLEKRIALMAPHCELVPH